MNAGVRSAGIRRPGVLHRPPSGHRSAALGHARARPGPARPLPRVPGVRPTAVLERHATLAFRVLLFGGLAVAVLWAFRALEPIILPLLFALLLSALLAPAVDRLAEHMRRGFAVTLIIVLFLLFIFGTLGYVIPALADQASEAVGQVEAGITKLPNVAGDLGLNADQTQELLSTLSTRLRDNLGGISGAVSAGALSIATTTIAVAFGAFLTFVLLIYLLIDGRGFWAGALRMLSPDRREGAGASGLRAWHALVVFIRSQVIVAAFDAIGIALGLFALGIPLVLPLGVLTFILSFVPYIGATVSGIIVALVALSTVGPGAMIGILAIAVLVQMIEGHLIYPLLVGRSLRLHPITVLLAVGVGSSVLGVLGAFFATPVLATVAAAAGLLPDTIAGEEEAPFLVKVEEEAAAAEHPEPTGLGIPGAPTTSDDPTPA